MVSLAEMRMEKLLKLLILGDSMNTIIKRINAIVVFLCIACLWACNEDKGNYNYSDEDAITKFNDIEGEYTVELGEQLQITPSLKSEFGHLEDFDFSWWYKSGDWTLLQEGLELDFVIGEPLNKDNTTYQLAFEAKNRHTGCAYRKLFNVKVVGSYGRGYVLMCENENGFDLNMIALNAANKYVPKFDILNTTGSSLPRAGVTPRGIYIFQDKTAPNVYHTDGSNRSLYVLTDQYTTRLKTSDFSWDESYDISTMLEPQSYVYNNYVTVGKKLVAEKMKFSFTAVSAGSYCHAYFYLKEENGECNWYVYNSYPMIQLASERMNMYRNGSGRYEPAPYLASTTYGTIFYDTEKNAFCLQTLPAGPSDMGVNYLWYTDPVVDVTDDGSFNFEEENQGLLYMGERYTGTTCSLFAITKQMDGNYKFLEFKSAKNNAGLVARENKLRACVLPADCGIANFKFIVAPPEPNNAFLYYVTKDNRVYCADVSNNVAVVTEITDMVLPKAEGYNEITSFKCLLPGVNGTTYAKTIAVATYNSSLGINEGGRIDFYEMPYAYSGELKRVVLEEIDENEDGEPEEVVEMSWKGFGKIVDLDYKP